MITEEIVSHLGLTALSIGGFYMIYHFLFKAGHHFQSNRILILLFLISSFVLPFISVQFYQIPFESINQFDLHQITDFWQGGSFETSETIRSSAKSDFDPFQWLFLIYCLGVILFIIRYLIKLLSVLKLIRQHETIKKDHYTIVKLKQGQSTFSFLHFIFMDQASLNQFNRAMFDHEKCHVDQRHSYDLLLVELLLSLQWFNPFIYLFKNRLVETHEFLADEYVLQSGHEKGSYLKLLGSVSGMSFSSRITSHFNSNIYKRILTMNANKKIKLKAWKMAIPFIFGAIIVILHSGFKNSYLNINISGEGNDTIPNFLQPIAIKNDTISIFLHPIDKEDLIRLASGYGMRMHPITKEKKMHTGIDYSADTGVKIYTSSDGVVRFAEHNGAFGNMVIIDHKNGFSTRYAHLSKILVKKGEGLKVGQTIGEVGNTGLSMAPHLHFEIMKDGKFVDPKDYLEPYD